ncbi:MAG: phosphatase PAP2 family protein [Anaerolineae bacterium]|nr:phosphatase PAP2 family protein [Anaerolineae bacterium]
MTVMMARLASFDVTLSQRFALSSQSDWWQVARVIAHVGDGYYVFGGLGVFYLLGWLLDNPLLRRDVLTIVLIILAAGIVTTGIKYVVRRQRPRPPDEFVSLKYDKYSFPSGHATRMAALAVTTVFFYPSLGWLLGAAALLVAVARVVVGIHYVSDIVVGLTVGVGVSWGAVRLLPLWPAFS